MKLRLSDEDRERYGCDEWLTVEPNRLSTLEAVQLERFGIDLQGWLEIRRRVIAGSASGALPPIEYIHCVAWLALRRAGVVVDICDLDVDVMGIRNDRTDESPGKAPSGRKSRTGGQSSVPPGDG